jgi:hypothetical protein
MKKDLNLKTYFDPEILGMFYLLKETISGSPPIW